MSPLMFRGSSAGLPLKGSSPSTAAGGSLLRTGSPPAQDITAVGDQPLKEAPGPTVLCPKVSSAEQAAR